MLLHLVGLGCLITAVKFTFVTPMLDACPVHIAVQNLELARPHQHIECHALSNVWQLHQEEEQSTWSLLPLCLCKVSAGRAKQQTFEADFSPPAGIAC